MCPNLLRCDEPVYPAESGKAKVQYAEKPVGTARKELVLEWSETKRKDGWQALLQEVAGKHEGNGFDRAFYQGQFGNEGRYADEEVWERMVDDGKKLSNGICRSKRKRR